LDNDLEYAQYLQELADNHPGIIFRGQFDHDQIGHVLQDIDIVVVPSVCYENAPLTIAEAFSAKTPVIATGIGGMAEAIQHNENGLLFKVNDIGDLATQMQTLIENPAMLNKLRIGCPSVRTVDDEVDELMGVYADLLGRKM
jgi:glycosyltransferase involved in cell wall biosynthesis